MAKGDGSITEAKRGVWRVCVSGGRDPLTGKRIKSQRIVHGTKAKARSVRDELRAALKSGSLDDLRRVLRRVGAQTPHLGGLRP